MANNFVPSITLPVEFGPNVPVLGFTNPLYFQTKITLTSCNNDVKFIPDQFDLKAYTELWEYGDDDDENDKGFAEDLELEFGFGDEYREYRSDTNTKSSQKLGLFFEENKFFADGVLSRRANSVLILAEVIPKNQIPDLKVPVIINYRYSSSENMEDQDAMELEDEKSKIVEKSVLAFIHFGPVIE
ncbi:hypothetical protein BB558_001407 [Smittium angustum]|uniref:Uncharacterized protein n=1 Tax=Smittium angustum TaxID=133377 RepID=A0A2U1JBG5_SMIAN|nr:hypothetical protein BB558_001407 [Smittium angustum]